MTTMKPFTTRTVCACAGPGAASAAARPRTSEPTPSQAPAEARRQRRTRQQARSAPPGPTSRPRWRRSPRSAPGARRRPSVTSALEAITDGPAEDQGRAGRPDARAQAAGAGRGDGVRDAVAGHRPAGRRGPGHDRRQDAGQERCRVTEVCGERVTAADRLLNRRRSSHLQGGTEMKRHGQAVGSHRERVHRNPARGAPRRRGARRRRARELRRRSWAGAEPDRHAPLGGHVREPAPGDPVLVPAQGGRHVDQHGLAGRARDRARRRARRRRLDHAAAGRGTRCSSSTGTRRPSTRSTAAAARWRCTWSTAPPTARCS